MKLIAYGHPVSHDGVKTQALSPCSQSNASVTKPRNGGKPPPSIHEHRHLLSLSLSPPSLSHTHTNSELQQTYKDNWSHILCAEFVLVSTESDLKTLRWKIICSFSSSSPSHDYKLIPYFKTHLKITEENMHTFCFNTSTAFNMYSMISSKKIYMCVFRYTQGKKSERLCWP